MSALPISVREGIEPVTQPAEVGNPAKPTITVTLDPAYHELVLERAKEDDRSPAKWLKRYVQECLASASDQLIEK